MTIKKTPNASMVSAQRLQDLRDLCQPSNFNTTEQAHSALHNGISQLLNERSLIEISPKRLMPGDTFFLKRPTADEQPYIVRDRIIAVKSQLNLMETSGHRTAVSHETYILFGTCGWECYLRLSDMTSYRSIDNNTEIHIIFPDRVFLSSSL